MESDSSNPINPDDHSGFFPGFSNYINPVINKIKSDDVIKRIWEKDYTLWSDKPDEILNRLGWLDCPVNMKENISEIEGFTNQVMDDGITDVILVGMGGSSLAPDMFGKVFGGKSEYPVLTVLDSTSPEYINDITGKVNLHKTIVIISTKSGTTVETISLFKYFYRLYLDNNIVEVGKHFVAITDPGSYLEKLANKINFRKIFINDPDIGGRFSALSYFGLVPASLAGADISRILSEAVKESDKSKKKIVTGKEPNNAGFLGITLGALAESGINKLHLILSNELLTLGYWIEQLIAESTGKNGKGIVPIISSEVNEQDFEWNDSLFVFINLGGKNVTPKNLNRVKESSRPFLLIETESIYGIGSEIFKWEFATAIAGHILNINPFDQPNVESSKLYTKKFIQDYKQEGSFDLQAPDFKFSGMKYYSHGKLNSIEDFNEWLVNTTKVSGYIVLQAFLNPSADITDLLERLSKKLTVLFRIPTLIGFGPRFLHSTGQLHKGDSGEGLFIQFTSDSKTDIEIPDEYDSEHSHLTFDALLSSQALGDYYALLENGRNVVSIDLGLEVIPNLKVFTDAV